MSNNRARAKWTIMIYMAVDDAVGIPESFQFLKELHELSQVLEPKPFQGKTDERNVHILLQTYTEWEKTEKDDGGFYAKRFEVDSDFSLAKSLEIQPDEFNNKQSMGTEEALSSFMKWCKDEYKAENYMLFLWGHGTGSSMFTLEDAYDNIKKNYPDITLTDLDTGQPILTITELEQTVLNAKNKVRIKIDLEGSDLYGPSEEIIITKRKSDFYPDGTVDLYDFLPPDDGREINPEFSRLRRYLSTRSNLDALLEKEIRKSLKKFEIDLLMIMGCCMQMVEFGYEIKKKKNGNNNKTFYYIGSEELIYFNGYNYTDTFAQLVANPDLTPQSFAIRLVQEAPLKDSYSYFERHSMAISCVDLYKSEDLAEYLDKFAESIVTIDKPELWKIIKMARTQCRHFGEDAYTYSFIDVTWFFKRFNALFKNDKGIINESEHKKLTALVEKTIDFLENDYIVFSWIGNKRTPDNKLERTFGGHGVGIYFPESEEAHANNKDLGKFFDKEKDPNLFSSQNYWNEMIFTYMKHYGESSNYPFSTVVVDKEKVRLADEINDWRRIIVNDLLNMDDAKTGVIGPLLMKSEQN
jgi:hypothetical protein